MYHFNFVPRAQRSSQERDCLRYPRGGEPCEGDFHPSRGAQWKHNCLLCVHLRKRPAGQEHQPWYHPKWPEHDDCCHRGSQRRKQLQYTGEEHTGMHLKALMLEKRMMKKAPKHQFKYVYLCLLHQTLNREEQKISAVQHTVFHQQFNSIRSAVIMQDHFTRLWLFIVHIYHYKPSGQ